MSTLPLDACRPISLDELTGQASLLTRIDRKYLLWQEEAAHILSLTSPAWRILDTHGTRQFCYESVYFDTPDRRCYAATAFRRGHRLKFRTRTYLDSETTFFEVKSKDARGHTVKERIPHAFEHRGELTEDDRAFAAQALTREHQRQRTAHDLSAALTVTYRRATLLQPDGASRATVDEALSWSSPDGARQDAERLVIIETKSMGHSSPLDALLWAHGYRPQPGSKYATGMASLHPELPANRWHRQLARYWTPDAAATRTRRTQGSSL